jgi:hypothetical protein
MSTHPPPKDITHVASLPHGYRAQFAWSSEGRLWVEWDPAPPNIRSARHRRKFFEAYASARRRFLTDVAAVVGGAVAVVDVPGEVTDGQFVLDCVMPPTKH